MLWKLAKPGEPSWPSPWGDGRPGWHTECVVMSLDLLGEGFDLHCGGMDLRFPHHENERAQAVALGKRFANHWMHNGFVVDAEGEKMSKSLGNCRQPARPDRPLRRRVPIAWCCCSRTTAARSASTGESIGAAQRALAGLDAFAARTAPLVGPTTRDDADASVIDRFVRVMDDDLDTPNATALLFDTVRRANTLIDAGDTAAVVPLVAATREITTAFGLELGSSDEVPPDVMAMASALDAARAAKDYTRADGIRAELQAAGWIVETTPAGTTVRR